MGAVSGRSTQSLASMSGRITTKQRLALEQLEDGIALFLSRRYISALTLAGAAEEILSRIIEERTGKHPFGEWLWQISNDIRSEMGNPPISKKDVFRMLNEARNRAKHHDPGKPQRVVHDRLGDALWQLQRATGAADGLRLKYRGRRAYRGWLKRNGFVPMIP
jgi:hypothetical protein